ncbi:hypothetical protein BHE74_00015535 [Ensete ventricosum]|nr:hypothetical protein BHE74_00015535 [Ensete ventricosum]RZS06294.1 hypothetical protein BHM03_00036936 [Ensete ventricosum]
MFYGPPAPPMAAGPPPKRKLFPVADRSQVSRLHAETQNTSMQHLVLRVPAKPGGGEGRKEWFVGFADGSPLPSRREEESAPVESPCLGMQGKSAALYIRKGGKG